MTICPGQNIPVVRNINNQLVISLELFSFAGVWEQLQGEGQLIESCTIITTDSNLDIQSLHQRMPVILDCSSAISAFEDTDPKEQITPSPNDTLQAFMVSNYVNNPRNNDKKVHRRGNIVGKLGDLIEVISIKQPLFQYLQ